MGRGRVLTAAEGFGHRAGRREARVRGRRGDKSELELAVARPGGPEGGCPCEGAECQPQGYT